MKKLRRCKGGIRHLQRKAKRNFNIYYDNISKDWIINGIRFKYKKGNMHPSYTANVKGLEVFIKLTSSRNYKVFVDDFVLFEDMNEFSFSSILITVIITINNKLSLNL